MAVRIKTSIQSEYVIPEIATEAEQTELAPLKTGVAIDTSVQAVPVTTTSNESNPEGDGEWKGFSINFALDDIEKIAEAGEKFFGVLDKIIKIYVAILKILRLFSLDLKSLTRLLKIVIKQLVKALKQFIESLISTGLYVTAIIPDFDVRNPNYVLPINGGFAEFKARFTASCLNRKDPTAPKFGPQDSVGGFIIATGAGSNDPTLLTDMIKNLETLSRFFGFRNPMPPPPSNISAKSGYFKSPTGEKKLGIEIRWEHPGSAISGFKLYRCKNSEGLKRIVVENNKQVDRFIYADDDFNGGEAYDVPFFPLKLNYKYVDFEVEPGVEYHYQVFSTAGFDFSDRYEFLRAVESPLGSRRVSAIPTECIPLSELKKYSLLDTDGNPVDNEGLAGEWVNLTIRDILPEEFDNVLQLLDDLADRLVGGIDLSGDAMSAYIKFLSKKVKTLLKITTKIKELVQRLLQYRLQGTVLVLNLSPEIGGMEEFTNRFNSAVIDEGVVKNLLGNEEAQDTSTIDAMQGIFVGVAVVYGFPDFSEGLAERFVPEEQAEQYKKQLERFEKSLKTFKQILGLEE